MPESNPPATFISDLRPSRVATIEATVSELQPTREIETPPNVESGHGAKSGASTTTPSNGENQSTLAKYRPYARLTAK